jgi:hypothetical protein
MPDALQVYSAALCRAVEHLYQFEAPGQLQGFSSLAKGIAHRNTLQVQLSSFTGRENER